MPWRRSPNALEELAEEIDRAALSNDSIREKLREDRPELRGLNFKLSENSKNRQISPI